MILQLVHNAQGYIFQSNEDLDYHLLEETTKENLLEYKEYLVDQLKMIEDILS